MGGEEKAAGRGLSMGKIEEAARALGKMLRESKEYKRFTKSSESLAGDKELNSLLDSVARKEREMEKKIKNSIPVEVSEKREFNQLKEKAQTHPVYAEFLEAEKAYIALMKRVNEAVGEAMGTQTCTE